MGKRKRKVHVGVVAEVQSGVMLLDEKDFADKLKARLASGEFYMQLEGTALWLAFCVRELTEKDAEALRPFMEEVGTHLDLPQSSPSPH